MNVAIVDYKVGNVASVANAVRALGCEACVTAEPGGIRRADKVILPGVGAFETGMANLRALGLVDVLRDEVLGGGKPLLGICLGMQLLAEESFENGRHEGLGWVPGQVVRLPDDAGLRVPHMGWNNVEAVGEPSLFSSLGRDADFYFIHSYHVRCRDEADVRGVCRYGLPFTAALRRGNIFGVQFHPEKSHKNGLLVLCEFLHSQGGEGSLDFDALAQAVLTGALSDDRITTL
jgi:imidazole glycerol-phosphate synthase subunit HisH